MEPLPRPAIIKDFSRGTVVATVIFSTTARAIRRKALAYPQPWLPGHAWKQGVLATCSLLEGERNGLVAIESFFGAEGCLRTQSGINWTKGFDKHVIEN